jgi:hypothetical protein
VSSRQTGDLERRPIEPFETSPALSHVGLLEDPHMSSNGDLRIMAEGRLLGLNSGDWMMLVGGFAFVALVVLLL